MSPTEMRTVCRVLRVRPDPSHYSEYPNVSDEVNDLISECAWFKVYDIAEALHPDRASRSSIWAELLEDKVNDSYLEEGIGGTMTDGEITCRGSGTFTQATQPDVIGAIQHVMSILECTAREINGPAQPDPWPSPPSEEGGGEPHSLWTAPKLGCGA